MKKRALIIGVTGQDGSFLADLLLEQGYEVHGLYRRSSTGNFRNIEHIKDKINLIKGDMADPISIDQALYDCSPHEVYNEADQDHVGWSHQIASYNYDITFSAVGRLLECVRRYDLGVKVFIPCSAMMFEGTLTDQQDIETPFAPLSPYACAKVGAFYLARFYRQYHGMFVSTAILYNHDSRRRQGDYLLHKICQRAVAIRRGEESSLRLYEPDYKVDIGHAKQYMQAVIELMQRKDPTDILIGTGRPSSIASLAACALEWAGIHLSPDEMRREHFTENRNAPLGTLTCTGNPALSMHAVDMTNVLMSHYGSKRQ